MARIRAFFILLIFVFCVLSVSQIFAQETSKFGECPVEYGFQGSYNFAKKTKSFVAIKKLEEISPRVLNNIQKQLKARVGEDFFRKLEFRYGDAKDFDDAAPLKAVDAERIDAYDFVFKFSDKSKGLETFNFKVVADSKGKLIDDLALPDIAANPQKGILIPCRQALAIAANNGFPPERSSIYFIYDWKSKTFVWAIYDNQAVKPDDSISRLIGQGTFRNIYIDANTGSVVKFFKQTILV